MEKLKGRLLYVGWFNRPWTLVMEDKEIDLWPVVDKFFTMLNGKRAKHEWESDGYSLMEDKKSHLRFKYVPNEYVLLEEPRSFANVHAYLDKSLVWLSGRMVEIEITAKEMKINADKSEEVMGVYRSKKNGLCEVPRGVSLRVCKLGQPDRCIFFSMVKGVFHCEKFNGWSARISLNRLAKSSSSERRSLIGSCEILG